MSPITRRRSTPTRPMQTETPRCYRACVSRRRSAIIVEPTAFAWPAVRLDIRLTGTMDRTPSRCHCVHREDRPEEAAEATAAAAVTRVREDVAAPTFPTKAKDITPRTGPPSKAPCNGDSSPTSSSINRAQVHLCPTSQWYPGEPRRSAAGSSPTSVRLIWEATCCRRWSPSLRRCRKNLAPRNSQKASL